MSFKIEPRRTHKRLDLAVPLRVTCRETRSHEWIENTQSHDVTPHGARFTLNQPVEIGQLLHLAMQMPVQLRLYDQAAPLYFSWGLVRFIKIFKFLATRKEATHNQYEVGVAFIGKTPPPGFLADPTKRYELSQPPGKEGLWSVRELDEIQEVIQPLRAAVQLAIEMLDESGQVSDREETLSRNLTATHVLVATTLPVEVGDTVRLSCEDEGVALKGVVRDRLLDDFGIARVRVDFIDAEWPVKAV